MSSLLTQVMTLLIFLFMTNRLDPAEFGVFALALVFVEFVHREGRYSMIDTLVQKQRVDSAALSTAFWCAMLLLGALCAAVIAISPLAGKVFESEKLPPVLAALALTMLPIPFCIGPTARLSVKMDFRSLALRPVVAILVSSVVALIVVFSPYPEWALVAQRATLITVEAIFLQVAEPVFPRLKFDRVWAKEFSQTAVGIFSGQSLSRWLLRVFDVLVALFLGAAATGIWRIAERIIQAALSSLANPLNSLWVITLSREDVTKSDRQTFFLNMVQTSSIILAPVFAGVSLIANDFTTGFLREEYKDVSIYLSVYAGFATLAPFYFYRNAALIAFKKTALLNLYSFMDLAVLIGLSLLLHSYGQMAMVAGLGLTYVLSIGPCMHMFVKQTGAELSQIMRRVTPAYVAVLSMVVICLIVRPYFADIPALARLILTAIIGASVYAGVLFFAFRAHVLNTIKLLKK